MAATLADMAQLAALAAATTGGTPQLASPPSAKKETLRSERMLRNMLAKDGVARSRSLSRGSSTAHHVPSSTRQPAPPLPNQQPQVYSPTPVSSNTLPRSPSGSGNSNASSNDERPMFVSSGPGGSLAMLFNPAVGSGSGAGSSSNTRPHLPTPRKTYDGATIFATAATSDRCASPPPAVRHFTAPPGTLIHTHSSPNINQKHSPPTDWLYEESSSPSPTSYSSGCNSSHPPGTPSSSFNIESASEFCRQQQGYVSFGDIQGLGRPAGEEEEERLERERIELEMRRKKGWWSWIEDGIISRPKTPGHE